MLETVAMAAAVVILFMVRVVMEDMVVIATPVKAEMVVTEGIVFSIKEETAVTVVMDLKVEAKEAAVVQALWGNADGQDGGHGQKGILGQDGGQGGNGGNSDFGKGGNGGNGGDVD